jgi:hypothetical protein
MGFWNTLSRIGNRVGRMVDTGRELYDRFDDARDTYKRIVPKPYRRKIERAVGNGARAAVDYAKPLIGRAVGGLAGAFRRPGAQDLSEYLASEGYGRGVPDNSPRVRRPRYK